MIGPMVIFASFRSDLRVIPSAYPHGMIPRYDEGMIGPMAIFGLSFVSDFRIIPSSYPQGMIPGYDEGMIGPMRV